VRETLHVLGISNALLYDLFKSGKLKKTKIGSRTFVTPQAIENLLNGE
jgi:hypothetical protein